MQRRELEAKIAHMNSTDLKELLPRTIRVKQKGKYNGERADLEMNISLTKNGQWKYEVWYSCQYRNGYVAAHGVEETSPELRASVMKHLMRQMLLWLYDTGSFNFSTI